MSLGPSPRAKAEQYLAALRTLLLVERDQRPPTDEERTALHAFPGAGCVALDLFPHAVTGQYKDIHWQEMGEELTRLLTPDEYTSAQRSTFTAFYTPTLIQQTLFAALRHFGVPDEAVVLEPGCGNGAFFAQAPAAMRFIGIELDRVSGRIAQALYPQHDIHIESIQATKLAPGSIDAVVGNCPFADLPMDYWGLRLSLHEYCVAKAVDALAPGGCVALVMTHSLLDKQSRVFREHLAQRVALLGALRLPADAFAHEGTRVIADLLFLHKRDGGSAAVSDEYPFWTDTDLWDIEGVSIHINRYFLDHPGQVLGTWTRQDRLYGHEKGYSVRSNGDLAAQLVEAVEALPRGVYSVGPRTSLPERTARDHPASSHLQEGSFFVTDTDALCQVQNGEAVPVIYAGKALRATTGLMGRRLAHLIHLRDAARAVLAAQHARAPGVAREEARTQLRQCHMSFVEAYGPINKVTVSGAADGTLMRRLPNLALFRRDPDAMLVMALEEYDEETETVRLAAICRDDVLGEVPTVHTVHTAEEALLQSLNQHGAVHLPYMCSLLGQMPVAQCLEALGDLVYHDPQTGEWQTADAYLSGNVRAKLRAAGQAAETPSLLAHMPRNIAALQAVQPEDVLPGEIDANLGAPWIPAADVAAFAQGLFDVRDWHIQIAYNATEALWSVEGSHWARGQTAAVADYGTPQMDGITLLTHGLNLKLPTIYESRWVDGKEVRTVAQAATLAAREKLTLIKTRFKAWVFADAARAERLVHAYNEVYNATRQRAFDGSHLTFPGMTARIALYPHQKDAVWRIMASGNTLLAHCVGSGKTNVLMAAGMKLRQAGLIRKFLIVVPNHLLEQFGRECLQLYPNARLLMASREDFGREQRKLLSARMAASTWDGILTTQSSFERIGMSVDFQRQFLAQKVADYEAMLVGYAQETSERDRAVRNIIKALEKQKARYEAKLELLAATEKKDDGLLFDDLGIDYIFVDESTAYKNSDVPSKMTRVAGIQSEGSQRALDLAMKIAYLNAQHPGRSVTFATGTPVTNTMVELYTLQRYLDPAGLEAAGVQHFDAWAASFGEVVERMEISPDGKTLRPRQRFAKFTNLPELTQMFRQFADVQTQADVQLDVPRVAGGKPAIIACPMSPRQQDLQAQLVRRYERVRNGEVKPWEDNALAITTDGRKLALEAQLLHQEAEDFPDTKRHALVAQVTEIWTRTQAQRATQLIFCDLGVHPTAWGFSLYGAISADLHRAGIPASEIAVMGEADTDAKKHRLFEQVRHGQVRILIGSTQKMGLGTNVQSRLIALHHLDAPWKPAEVEQREGRILRQGNMHAIVEIYRYVTTGSFDAFLWQALETKARFIAEILTGTHALRQAEDLESPELSYAEVKAIASGNPAMLTLAETDAELRRLALLQQHFTDTQYLARLGVQQLPAAIAAGEQRLLALQADWSTLQAHATGLFQWEGTEQTAETILEPLTRRLAQLFPSRSAPRIPLGQYRGLEFGLLMPDYAMMDVYLCGAGQTQTLLDRRSHGARAVLNALARLVADYPGAIARLRYEQEVRQARLRTYTAQSRETFAHTAYQERLQGIYNALQGALTSTDPAVQAETSAHVAAIEAVRATASHHSERLISTGRRRQQAIEAITTRIQRHQRGTAERASAARPAPILRQPRTSPGARRPGSEQASAQLSLF